MWECTNLQLFKNGYKVKNKTDCKEYFNIHLDNNNFPDACIMDDYTRRKHKQIIGQIRDRTINQLNQYNNGQFKSFKRRSTSKITRR